MSVSLLFRSVSLAMAGAGLVLLATAVMPQPSWRLLWYALPAAALGLTAPLILYRWRSFLRWHAALKATARARQQTHDEALLERSHERAVRLVESKGQALDYRARAISNAQISIWQVHVPTARVIFEGQHIGSSGFLPDTRIYEGRAWFERLHPQDAEQVEYRFREFLKQRVPVFEMEYRAPNERGGWRWVLARGLVIEKDDRGRTVMAAGTHTDIHQRKLAQIARAQEKALFDNGPVVLFRCRVDGDLVVDFISPNAASLWGFDLMHWSGVGRPLAFMVYPQDLPAVQASIRRAVDAGHISLDCQFRLMKGDGAAHWHSMRVVFELERGVTYARGYLVDIEERKLVEADAQGQNRHLSTLVRQLNLAQADSVVLQETSDMLNSADDLPEAFDILRRAADSLFPGWSGALSAANPQGGLTEVGQWGQPPAHDLEFEGRDCWGLRRGKPHSYSSHNRQVCCPHIHPPGTGGLASYVCLPMSANGETVGALHLFADTAATEPQVAEVALRAERFAETLKLAMSNLRLRAWLRDQATRDGLTGLYNRRLLDERLPVEIKRSLRDQAPASLAMIDVDHFKRFNDDFGHDAGDLVLKAIGQLLLDRVRVYDLACRYGGEELVLLMPSCHLQDAQVKLESLRQAIGGLEVRQQGKLLPRVTVSIGLAHTFGGSPELLLRQADEALYAAKHQGRNRLVVHVDDMASRESA